MKRDEEAAAPVAVEAPMSEDLGYTETIVEYAENRQRKTVFVALVVVLVLLIVLLAGSAFAVLYWARGQSGAPTAAELPEDLGWVRSIYGWGETLDTSLAAPSDVAIAEDGSIWAVSGSQMIVGFNPDGSLKQLIQPERGFGQGQVNTLESITIGPDDTIYVTDQGKGSIERFAPDGTWLGQWPVALPIEVASDGGDRLGVTGEGSFGILKMLGENAEVLGSWGSRGSGEEQFDLPHGIAFGADGVVFVSDTHNARVKAFDKSGKRLWTSEGAPRGYEQSQESTTQSIFQLPSGMTVDGRGRVVVADPFGFNLTVLDPASGALIDQYGDFGAEDGFFAYPTGVDYDEDRDWFAVADTANNRIQIVRIPGSGASPIAAIRRNLVGPVWICCIPLFLLLTAVIAAALRRRRSRETTDGAVDGGTGGENAATMAPD